MPETKTMMKVQDKNIRRGSAASRKRDLLLLKALAPSTKAFFQNIPFKENMHGLDLGCCTGHVTMQLKVLIGESGKMTGIDMDATNINLAKEIVGQHPNAHDITFRQENILEWKEDHSYDFIYSRLFLNQLSQPQPMLHQIYRSLKTGGFAMVEELDFSNYHCFPNSYAFDRFVELYTEAKKQQGIDANIGNKLQGWFQKAGFKSTQIQRVPPIYVNGQSKHIASLTLESIATILLMGNLTTPTELQALLFELKDFEKQKNTMISLPGIYQVLGYKI